MEYIINGIYKFKNYGHNHYNINCRLFESNNSDAPPLQGVNGTVCIVISTILI